MNTVTRLACAAFLASGLIACSSTPTWDDIPQQDVAAWKSMGMDPESATAWIDSGFTAEQAAAWRASGFQRASAVEWSKEGFSAEEAAAWKANSFDLDEAVDNRKKGLSPNS